MAKISVDELVDIAFVVEEGDPIDWNKLKQTKESSMRLIASRIIEQFDKEEITDADRLIMLATITKLLTSNMILNARLLTLESKGNR
jgi:hypothetical protein